MQAFLNNDCVNPALDKTPKIPQPSVIGNVDRALLQ